MNSILINKSRITNYGVRILVWLCVVGIITWIFWNEFVPTGKKIIEHNFIEQSVIVTDMRPGEFLKMNQKDNEQAFITIVNYPIYFHVRTPGKFDNAKFLFNARAMSNSTIQFGGQTGAQLTDFSYKKIEIPADGLWHEVSIDADMKKLRYNVKDRRYQFSFTGKGLFSIKSMRIEFTRKKLF